MASVFLPSAKRHTHMEKMDPPENSKKKLILQCKHQAFGCTEVWNADFQACLRTSNTFPLQHTTPPKTTSGLSRKIHISLKQQIQAAMTHSACFYLPISAITLLSLHHNKPCSGILSCFAPSRKLASTANLFANKGDMKRMEHIGSAASAKQTWAIESSSNRVGVPGCKRESRQNSEVAASSLTEMGGSSFLRLPNKWERKPPFYMGGSYMYMIRMHAYRCDKSNDISICNLKEFECIQEYKNNSDISIFIF